MLIVMVWKPDVHIRVCIDYRALNECIVKDSFPIPRIDDLLDISYVMPNVWHTWISALRITKHECRMMVHKTTLSLRQPSKAPHRMEPLVY
jgi:hypothetical protein